MQSSQRLACWFISHHPNNYLCRVTVKLKISEVEMRLIHLTCWTSWLSLASLNHAQALTSACSWQSHLQSVFTLEIAWLIGSCGSLPWSTGRKYRMACDWPGKRPKSKIQTTVSIECVLLSYHHKVQNPPVKPPWIGDYGRLKSILQLNSPSGLCSFFLLSHFGWVSFFCFCILRFGPSKLYRSCKIKPEE